MPPAPPVTLADLRDKAMVGHDPVPDLVAALRCALDEFPDHLFTPSADTGEYVDPVSAEAVAERLGALRAVLDPLGALRDALFDLRRFTFADGRQVDPMATHKVMSEAAGVAIPMVVKTLRALGIDDA